MINFPDAPYFEVFWAGSPGAATIDLVGKASKKACTLAGGGVRGVRKGSCSVKVTGVGSTQTLRVTVK